LSVKPGMDAKEIAILHYQLVKENNWDEWIKSVMTRYRKNAKKRGAKPFYWWNTGRKRVDEQGMTYEFSHQDERFSSEKRKKFFFSRFDKEGKQSGMPVPITLLPDPDENEEWRVSVSSW
jgi:hypothetical protein